MLKNDLNLRSSLLDRSFPLPSLLFKDIHLRDVRTTDRNSRGAANDLGHKAREQWHVLARKDRGAWIQSAEATELETQPSYVGALAYDADVNFGIAMKE